ncbi:DUF1156 domain-containing protein [Pseudomonas aeruginosa]|uniref:DUF1156 domain-containing protein n=1 Tax=Pseudomonas aeruginosa TaxID=287 RepID=UPI0011B76A97|nr:DUF1156 domain-containing protein [Pseudomonas aeruginosa]TWV87887.1 DUF1156 domain-containing protein [Pseudomonas aeruginosa]
MTYPIKTPKKLIEVALPLDAINVAAAREKSIRHGHPSTLHLWWARRPLAAARAVIFAQMVNDPGYERHLGRGVNKEKAAAERERLFKIIEDLVQWENTNNEEVLQRARAEIWKSWRETCELNKGHPQAAELFNPEKLPGFHDPFAGGGALPLEAQRLGLESYASDLNPVAVTINKAMIEIPPRFAGRAPIGPEVAAEKGTKKRATRDAFEDWSGTKGLAEDVYRYGSWVQKEAERKIGALYPKIKITSQQVERRPDLEGLEGQELTVLIWMWARTIKCPNPACQAEMPLLKSYQLSEKKGKEFYLKPVVKDASGRRWVDFEVCAGFADKKGNVERTSASCECCGSSVRLSDIEVIARSGLLTNSLVAIVAQAKGRKVFLPACKEHQDVALSVRCDDHPIGKIDHWRSCTNCVVYGLVNFEDLFTSRQLLALTTFADLVKEVYEDVLARSGDKGYAQAIAIYLACANSRLADLSSAMTSWISNLEAVRNTFARQAIPMVWDFTECNPVFDKWQSSVEWVCKVIEISLSGSGAGHALQLDATNVTSEINSVVVSTDPPYYDNIPYSNLSDYFYIWLRRSLRDIDPEVFSTISVPKMPELVANQFRHGGKQKAKEFFEKGIFSALSSIGERAHPSFPVTVYYAFKQSESTGDEISSTGWETFLEGVIRSGFSITGTWPVRTERGARTMSIGMNALASSIVLVCAKRDVNTGSISRREFIRELNLTLPDALLDMTRGGVNSPVAPVDLSQAIIGPGMEVFSKYSSVLEADGSAMTVRSALQLINRFIGEDDFDHDTQFCLAWFEQYGWAEGKYGDADVLARAKGTSVTGLVDAGVVESSSGNLHLLKWAEMPRDWSPENDSRLPVWEALHQLIRALNQDGETAAGQLLARMPDKTAGLTALTYRLYTLCERQGWSNEARAYNELQGAWPGIEQASQEVGHIGSQSVLDI